MANDVSILVGLNRASTAVLAPNGVDASGDVAVDPAGFVGVAVVVPGTDKGVQLDSVRGSAFAGAMVALRVVVVRSTMAPDALVSFLATAGLRGLSFVGSGTAGTDAFGMWNPDAATGAPATLTGVTATTALSGAGIVAEDNLYHNSAVDTFIGGVPIPLSSRPGGGLVLAPGESAAVLLFPLRRNSGNALDGDPVTQCRASLTVNGGEVSALQAAHGSAAPAPGFPGAGGGDLGALSRFDSVLHAPRGPAR